MYPLLQMMCFPLQMMMCLEQTLTFIIMANGMEIWMMPLMMPVMRVGEQYTLKQEHGVTIRLNEKLQLVMEYR